MFVVLVFRFGYGVRLVDDHGLQIKDEDTPGIAAGGCDGLADRGDGLFENRLRRRRDEDAFGFFARAPKRPPDRAPESVAARAR